MWALQRLTPSCRFKVLVVQPSAGTAVLPTTASLLGWRRSWVSVHRLFGAGTSVRWMGLGGWGMGDGGTHLGFWGCLGCCECALQRQAGTLLACWAGRVWAGRCWYLHRLHHTPWCACPWRADATRPATSWAGGKGLRCPRRASQLAAARRGAGRNPACPA